MNTYYLTFGQKYRYEQHPSGFNIDPDGYVQIVAESYDSAIKIAQKNFGLEWCFLYQDKESVSRYFPNGCLFEVN